MSVVERPRLLTRYWYETTGTEYTGTAEGFQSRFSIVEAMMNVHTDTDSRSMVVQCGFVTT